MQHVFLAFQDITDLNAHEGYTGTCFLGAASSLQGALNCINKYRRNVLDEHNDLSLQDGYDCVAQWPGLMEVPEEGDAGKMVWVFNPTPGCGPGDGHFQELQWYILEESVQ